MTVTVCLGCVLPALVEGGIRREAEGKGEEMWKKGKEKRCGGRESWIDVGQGRGREIWRKRKEEGCGGRKRSRDVEEEKSGEMWKRVER